MIHQIRKKNNMKDKVKLLKELGFSEDFIKVLEDIKENEINNLDSNASINPFEAVNMKSSDMNDLVIEKSVKPISNVYSDMK